MTDSRELVPLLPPSQMRPQSPPMPPDATASSTPNSRISSDRPSAATTHNGSSPNPTPAPPAAQSNIASSSSSSPSSVSINSGIMLPTAAPRHEHVVCPPASDNPSSISDRHSPALTIDPILSIDHQNDSLPTYSTSSASISALPSGDSIRNHAPSQPSHHTPNSTSISHQNLATNLIAASNHALAAPDCALASPLSGAKSEIIISTIQSSQPSNISIGHHISLSSVAPDPPAQNIASALASPRSASASATIMTTTPPSTATSASFVPASHPLPPRSPAHESPPQFPPSASTQPKPPTSAFSHMTSIMAESPLSESLSIPCTSSGPALVSFTKSPTNQSAPSSRSTDGLPKMNNSNSPTRTESNSTSSHAQLSVSSNYQVASDHRQSSHTGLNRLGHMGHSTRGHSPRRLSIDTSIKVISPSHANLPARGMSDALKQSTHATASTEHPHPTKSIQDIKNKSTQSGTSDTNPTSSKSPSLHSAPIIQVCRSPMDSLESDGKNSPAIFNSAALSTDLGPNSSRASFGDSISASQSHADGGPSLNESSFPSLRTSQVDANGLRGAPIIEGPAIRTTGSKATPDSAVFRSNIAPWEQYDIMPWEYQKVGTNSPASTNSPKSLLSPSTPNSNSTNPTRLSKSRDRPVGNAGSPSTMSSFSGTTANFSGSSLLTISTHFSNVNSPLSSTTPVNGSGVFFGSTGSGGPQGKINPTKPTTTSAAATGLTDSPNDDQIRPPTDQVAEPRIRPPIRRSYTISGKSRYEPSSQNTPSPLASNSSSVLRSIFTFGRTTNSASPQKTEPSEIGVHVLTSNISGSSSSSHDLGPGGSVSPVGNNIGTLSAPQDTSHETDTPASLSDVVSRRPTSIRGNPTRHKNGNETPNLVIQPGYNAQQQGVHSEKSPTTIPSPLDRLDIKSLSIIRRTSSIKSPEIRSPSIVTGLAYGAQNHESPFTSMSPPANNSTQNVNNQTSTVSTPHTESSKRSYNSYYQSIIPQLLYSYSHQQQQGSPLLSPTSQQPYSTTGEPFQFSSFLNKASSHGDKATSPRTSKVSKGNTDGDYGQASHSSSAAVAARIATAAAIVAGGPSSSATHASGANVAHHPPPSPTSDDIMSLEYIRARCIRVYNLNQQSHIVEISGIQDSKTIREKIYDKFNIQVDGAKERYELYIEQKSLKTERYVRDSSIDDLTLMEICMNPDHPYRAHLVIDKKRHSSKSNKDRPVSSTSRRQGSNRSDSKQSRSSSSSSKQLDDVSSQKSRRNRSASLIAAAAAVVGTQTSASNKRGGYPSSSLASAQAPSSALARRRTRLAKAASDDSINSLDLDRDPNQPINAETSNTATPTNAPVSTSNTSPNLRRKSNAKGTRTFQKLTNFFGETVPTEPPPKLADFFGEQNLSKMEKRKVATRRFSIKVDNPTASGASPVADSPNVARARAHRDSVRRNDRPSRNTALAGLSQFSMVGVSDHPSAPGENMSNTTNMNGSNDCAATDERAKAALGDAKSTFSVRTKMSTDVDFDDVSVSIASTTCGTSSLHHKTSSRKLEQFFGDRPPSQIIADNLEEFFPGISRMRTTAPMDPRTQETSSFSGTTSDMTKPSNGTDSAEIMESDASGIAAGSRASSSRPAVVLPGTMTAIGMTLPVTSAGATTSTATSISSASANINHTPPRQSTTTPTNAQIPTTLSSSLFVSTRSLNSAIRESVINKRTSRLQMQLQHQQTMAARKLQSSTYDMTPVGAGSSAQLGKSHETESVDGATQQNHASFLGQENNDIQQQQQTFSYYNYMSTALPPEHSSLGMRIFTIAGSLSGSTDTDIPGIPPISAAPFSHPVPDDWKAKLETVQPSAVLESIMVPLPDGGSDGEIENTSTRAHGRQKSRRPGVNASNTRAEHTPISYLELSRGTDSSTSHSHDHVDGATAAGVSDNADKHAGVSRQRKSLNRSRSLDSILSGRMLSSMHEDHSSKVVTSTMQPAPAAGSAVAMSVAVLGESARHGILPTSASATGSFNSYNNTSVIGNRHGLLPRQIHASPTPFTDSESSPSRVIMGNDTTSSRSRLTSSHSAAMPLSDAINTASASAITTNVVVSGMTTSKSSHALAEMDRPARTRRTRDVSIDIPTGASNPNMARVNTADVDVEPTTHDADDQSADLKVPGVAAKDPDELSYHSTDFRGSETSHSQLHQSESYTDYKRMFSVGPDQPRTVNWIKGPLIGAGSFGKVFYGVNCDTGEIMAIKQVQIRSTATGIHMRSRAPPGTAANSTTKDDAPFLSQEDDAASQSRHKMLQALHREITLLKDLDHENIVRYLGFDVQDQFISVFLEYVSGGSVASALAVMGSFEEPLVRSIVSQVLSGLDYLHQRFIIHRDIKGGNILIDEDGWAKISDFGISKKSKYQMAYRFNSRMSIQGSVYWMAPEVVKAKGYSAKVDIWSLGCVVLEMFTGSHPWRHLDEIQTMWRLGREDKPPLPLNMLSPEASAFLSLCFTVSPEARPTANELLLHPFSIYDTTFNFREYKVAAIQRQQLLDEDDDDDDNDDINEEDEGINDQDVEEEGEEYDDIEEDEEVEEDEQEEQEDDEEDGVIQGNMDDDECQDQDDAINDTCKVTVRIDDLGGINPKPQRSNGNATNMLSISTNVSDMDHLGEHDNEVPLNTPVADFHPIGVMSSKDIYSPSHEHGDTVLVASPSDVSPNVDGTSTCVATPYTENQDLIFPTIDKPNIDTDASVHANTQ